jgi:hypothetical protein
MHRRPLGRGRWLAALAALVLLVACVLPWYTVGGGQGLTALSTDAFQGAGIFVFLAALATLALVALPYASDRPVAVDRALSYVILVVLGITGIVLRLVDTLTSGLPIDGLRPDRAAGIWLSMIGLVVLARAAFEISQMREPR